jgi:outer membrane protein assembly factor BamB
LLTLVDDRIYFNSNLGLVASLDVEQGHIAWLHRYDRVGREQSTPQLTDLVCLDRDPSPCLYHDGLLIVAPADTQSIFALDADTGRRVWVNDALPDALHLLGVVRQHLVVSGHRLWMLDLRSGAVQFAWPESEHAGIRGMGRGLVAGDEIFWPTRREIYVLDASTGARTRAPISLAPVSDCGANLAAAGGYLIAAGHDKLMAFGPTPAPNPNKSNQEKSVATTD